LNLLLRLRSGPQGATSLAISFCFMLICVIANSSSERSSTFSGSTHTFFYLTHRFMNLGGIGLGGLFIFGALSQGALYPDRTQVTFFRVEHSGEACVFQMELAMISMQNLPKDNTLKLHSEGVLKCGVLFDFERRERLRRLSPPVPAAQISDCLD
jgi:hypothetical protein